MTPDDLRLETRDLGDLSSDCLAIDGSFQSALVQADVLTQYAWRFRYPGVPSEPDAAEAGDGLHKAEVAVREIERRLPTV